MKEYTLFVRTLQTVPT